MDLDSLPEEPELDYKPQLNTSEKAIEYITDTVKQLKEIPWLSDEDLCVVLCVYLRRMSNKAWVWTYRERKARLALTRQIQLMGVYVPDSIKGLNQFVNSKGVSE